MTTTEIVATLKSSEPVKSRMRNGSPVESTWQVPLTTDQYHQMIETGILVEGEPIELLDGVLVRKDRSAAGKDPMTVGGGHSFSVQALIDLNPKFGRFGCHIRVQQPLTIPNVDEPEPDGAIVKGTKRRYQGRHPGPAEVTCVIEVSDSSLGFDRTTKLRIYADAGIPQYVIINLVDHVVEVYSKPIAGRGRYAEATTLRPGKRVEFLSGTAAGAASKAKLAASVKSLLPRT